MKGDKKLYLYSGLAIALAVIFYVVVSNKKPSSDTSNEDTSDEEENEGTYVTPSGDIITNEQFATNTEMLNILKLPLAQIKLNMLNKKVYTKINNVNPRQTPNVNNGWFVNNGVGGRITQKGTLAGVVTDVSSDKGLMSNAQGRVYVWFKIKPSAEAIKQIEDDSNILLGTNIKDTFWLREDTIVKK
jgi:hypothetical protein